MELAQSQNTRDFVEQWDPVSQKILKGENKSALFSHLEKEFKKPEGKYHNGKPDYEFSKVMPSKINQGKDGCGRQSLLTPTPDGGSRSFAYVWVKWAGVGE